jgi:hypothetical protein
MQSPLLSPFCRLVAFADQKPYWLRSLPRTGVKKSASCAGKHMRRIDFVYA